MSHAEDHEGTRRDFLYYATAGAGAVTAGAAIWPLVDQMNPSADVQALSSIRVDVGGVNPGTQISVKYLGKPVFIRRRTQEKRSRRRARWSPSRICPTRSRATRTYRRMRRQPMQTARLTRRANGW